jgi:hypothetical protein
VAGTAKGREAAALIAEAVAEEAEAVESCTFSTAFISL